MLKHRHRRTLMLLRYLFVVFNVHIEKHIGCSFCNFIYYSVKYIRLAQGPRVIVVGPTDSGKSTLSRMLLSWAAKLGWKPTFVDLDIGQGAITIPGCIAATPIELPIDPVEGIPLEMPLVYFFGHATPR